MQSMMTQGGRTLGGSKPARSGSYTANHQNTRILWHCTLDLVPIHLKGSLCTGSRGACQDAEHDDAGRPHPRWQQACTQPATRPGKQQPCVWLCMAARSLTQRRCDNIVVDEPADDSSC